MKFLHSFMGIILLDLSFFVLKCEPAESWDVSIDWPWTVIAEQDFEFNIIIKNNRSEKKVSYLKVEFHGNLADNLIIKEIDPDPELTQTGDSRITYKWKRRIILEPNESDTLQFNSRGKGLVSINGSISVHAMAGLVTRFFPKEFPLELEIEPKFNFNSFQISHLDPGITDNAIAELFNTVIVHMQGDYIVAIPNIVHGISNSEDSLGVFLADAIQIQWKSPGSNQAVERSMINRVLEEQKLQGGDLFDDKTATEFGKFIGANAMVLGKYWLVSDRLKIIIKVIDVQTMKQLSAGKVYIPLSH